VNIMGYCTDCHRVRTVRVSSSGMAHLAASRVAQGVCQSCTDKADDLRRSEPMIDLRQHLEDTHKEGVSPEMGFRQLRSTHDTLHHRDPNGRNSGHRHVGPDDRVLRTRR